METAKTASANIELKLIANAEVQVAMLRIAGVIDWEPVIQS